MKLFIVLACILFSTASAIDFKTIGQDEMVQFIQERYDLNGQGEMSEETLGNTLRDLLVTDLDVIDTGDIEYSAKDKGIVIESSFDTQATVSFTGKNSTRSVSSERKGDADVHVSCRKSGILDIIYLSGTASQSMSGKHGSQSITITREVSFNATVITARVGNMKAFKARPDFGLYGDLIKTNKAAHKRGASISSVAFASSKHVETTIAGGKAIKTREMSEGKAVAVVTPKILSVTGESSQSRIRNGTEPQIENTIWTAATTF